MYEDASIYSKMSEDHKAETNWVIQRFWGKLKWDRNEDVLDVGCGSGDALYHIIRPSLPNDFRNLVGIDMSEKMISFARSKWKDPKLCFETMDIGTRKDPLQFFSQDIQELGGFSKILSFFCLQWVKDRRRMLENLYSLLRPGGQAFLLVVVRSGIYQVWDKITRNERWKEYFNDVETPHNEYVYMDDFDRVFCASARQVGFSVVDCHVLDRKDIFTTKNNTDEEMIVRMRSVDPLVSLLPQEEKMPYLEELLVMVKRDVSPRGATDYTGLLLILEKPS